MLLDSAMTGWEIKTEYWKTIRKFSLASPRVAHVSVGIDNQFIYSIGGKNDKAGLSVERYQLDNETEVVCELHFPRYYASACTFDNNFIYVYGGHNFNTGELINKIERIDHFNPEVSPSLYELDQQDLPALVGSIIKQYDNKSILILGGKSRKFSKKVYHFDCEDLSVQQDNIKDKNHHHPVNVYNYQSD